MGRSYKLFTLRGIDVRLHLTFPLIFAFAAYQFWVLTGSISGAVFGVAAVGILFILVTLHEFGHSVAAQYYGVEVKRIVLSPIGGVAHMAQMPDNPRQELVIALAGPAVNVAIAVLMAIAWLALGIDLASPGSILSGQNGFGATSLFSYIFVSNIFLAVFNMIPAFPMDGGRVLRALLAMRIDIVRATSIAAGVGRVIAVLMGLYGLFTGSFFLVIIALFIFSAAGQEVSATRSRNELEQYMVNQAMSPSATSLAPNQTLRQAADMMVLTRQSSFAIVDSEDRLIGFLPRQDLTDALNVHSPVTALSALMRSDVLPVLPADDLFYVARRLSSEELDALPVVVAGRYVGLVTRGQIERLIRTPAGSPVPTSRPRTAQ